MVLVLGLIEGMLDYEFILRYFRFGWFTVLVFCFDWFAREL